MAPSQRTPRAPRTHAEAARQRKDLVSGEVMPEGALLRFVAGPDGRVVPDLGRILPGRGMWVAANRAAVDEAARRGGFSRSAKAKLTADPDLADQVEALLRRKLLDRLGLARKAGELTYGFDKVSAALASGKVAWLIEAADGASDGRRKIMQIAHREGRPPPVLGVFDSHELGLALGLENVIHTAFLAGRGAERWTEDVHRLSGFRPLLPESWREEP
jgi:predicted RNA-binding protein YlxR (DUF448 family)